MLCRFYALVTCFGMFELWEKNIDLSKSEVYIRIKAYGKHHRICLVVVHKGYS